MPLPRQVAIGKGSSRRNTASAVKRNLNVITCTQQPIVAYGSSSNKSSTGMRHLRIAHVHVLHVSRTWVQVIIIRY